MTDLSDAGKFSVTGQLCMPELAVDGQENCANILCFSKNTRLCISSS